MTSKKKKIAFVSLGILLVAVVAMAIILPSYLSTPDLSELVLDINWGTSKTEVEETALNKGFFKQSIDKELERMSVFNFTNFAGISGADGRAIFTYDDSSKLTEVICYFKTSESLGEYAIDAKTVDKLKDSFEKGFTKKIGSVIETPDDKLSFSGFWIGEQSLISMTYSKGEDLTIAFSDIQYEDELVEYLKSLE